MNLHQFRFVQEAVRRGLNLTETAKALYTSQPGISKAILELVDGQRTVAQIAAELSARYQTDVTADVTDYLSHLAERELIQ